MTRRPSVLDLHGNAWRFPEGHRVRVEIAQDDDPYVRRSDTPATMVVDGVDLADPDPGNRAGGPRRRRARRDAAGRGAVRRPDRPHGPLADGRAHADRRVRVSRDDGLGNYEPLPQDDDESFRRSFTGAPGTSYDFAARGDRPARRRGPARAEERGRPLGDEADQPARAVEGHVERAAGPERQRRAARGARSRRRNRTSSERPLFSGTRRTTLPGRGRRDRRAVLGDERARPEAAEALDRGHAADRRVRCQLGERGARARAAAAVTTPAAREPEMRRRPR